MKIRVHRIKDVVDVLILKNKDDETYSFVNLTKSHICPCRFSSIDDAIDDLNSYVDVLSWEVINE